MGPSSYGRIRSSPLPRLLIGLLTVVLGGVGTVVVLAAAGVIDLPFLHKPGAARPKPEGIGIPLSARPIQAFTQVTREHLMDQKTLDILAIYLPAEKVAQSGLLTFDKVVGRVLKNDHNAGYGFTEKDFLPRGTRPGLVAGVPVGKRSFVLEADKVAGIRGLRIGDRIDLLATVPVDQDKPADRSGGKGKAPPAQDVESNFLNRAGLKPLVQSGVVLLPPTTRQVPVPGSPIGPDGKPKTRAIEETIVAIDPKEVAPLTEALAMHDTICCVAHSGLPDEKRDPPAMIPPLAVRAIPAYTAISREHLMDPKTVEFLFAYRQSEQVPPSGLLSLDKILGRVLKSDHKPGYGFTEQDFLPEGTHPGLVAGVPPGKRAFVLPADRITGVHGLRPGDEVDVLMSMPIEPSGSGDAKNKGQISPASQHGGGSGRLRKIGVVPLVNGGVVVRPVTLRPTPSSSTPTGKDAALQTHAVPEIVLAIDPAEVARLAQALAVDTEIYCVAHSGHPDDVAGLTPGLPTPPAPQVHEVEVIVGNKRGVKRFTEPASGWPKPLPPRKLGQRQGKGPESPVLETADP